MISQAVTDIINVQIGKEFFSAYLYRAMAAYFEEKSMSGFAHWFKKQAEEECEHAERFIEYLEDNNKRIVLPALDKPDVAFANVEAALKAAYDHEIFITNSIYDIAKLAKKEEDFRTLSFLNWFHDEQLEEEKSVLALLEEYQYIDGDRAAQLDMDRKLGKRQ